MCIFIRNSTSGFAQEIEWQNTIGGNSEDKLSSIQQTTDGGYILGGYSASSISGDKTDDLYFGRDYWIVKVDSLGVIQWQNNIGADANDQLNSIRQTLDGGYILGGSSNSSMSGDKTENNNGSSGIGNDDYWIVKVDSLGVIQWQNTIGGSLDDELYSVQQTTDGGYILGGFSESNISGDKTENCHGNVDYWIVKTDSTGAVQWQNTIGGDSIDRLYSVQQTTDEGYILGGSSNSNISGDKSENCIGISSVGDYWIVKVDSMGAIVWQNTIGGGESDGLYSIQQTTDGGYILGGTSSSGISGDKTEYAIGVIGSYDYWILKVDSMGAIQWQNTIGGDDSDYLTSIQQTSDGGYILGGFSGSFISGDKTENNNGNWAYWIVKVDSLGAIQWQNAIGGEDGGENLTSIQQTIDGGYMLGGWSYADISGDKTEDSHGSMDYWIVKLSGKYNLVSGKVFADLNSNGQQDIGEPSLPGKKITEQGTGRFSFSQTNGQYFMTVLDSGSHIVLPQSQPWFNPNPITHTASFSGINQTDSLNDFAFQPQGSFEDVCITITPLGNFRSGFTASYMISYANNGNTTLSSYVVFYNDSNVSYQSASISPNFVTQDSLIWVLPTLSPFQSGSIIVTVNVNLGLPIGTLINSSVHIEPSLDDNPGNNDSNWEVYTTGSFDPNDILVNEDTLTTTQLSNAPWLEYIIRFQNTGNDTAFTVKILNPMDTNKLNLSTFEFTNASHPVNLNWINYQRNMEFKFENILLVDSNTNEPLSHGFVRYRIQPKTTLTAGDSITNFAAIYFDFNEPVITNTAKTIIILPTGIASTSPAQGKLHVFPNPTENTINISGIQLENGKAQLRLMDIYGKLILEKTVTTTTSTIETNQLSNGVYLIQSGGVRATFVKQ